MEINTINFIFFIISISFFFLSQIFLLVQGIKNYEFSKFDDDKLIVEKTLFEQFSQEVYESINTPFSSYTIKSNCDVNNQIRPSLYLNTYYDCRNIYSSELKEKCQNNIISNNTDCSPYSSNSDYDYDIKYEDRLNYDGRIKYCQYFSRFTQKISKIYSYYICRDNTMFTYEDLLFKSMPLYDLNGNKNICPNNLKKCGILDTKNNILCLPQDYKCPYNDLSIQSTSGDNTVLVNSNNNYYLKYSNSDDKKIFSSIFISENQPMNHEWDIYVRETYEDIDEEDIIKRRRLTKKDFELVCDKDDNTYSKININFQVNEILENNNIYSNILTSELNKDQNLNIYARNYIGFKDYDELLDFKKFFNEKDPMDNPLYKLTSSGHNPIITITFSSLFIVLDILALVFGILKFKSQENNNNKLILSFFIVNCVFFVVELFIIGFHFVKYPKIHIDMDERMKKVLDLYNDRTFSTQVYRIISLVFSTVSLILNNIKFSNKENLIHNE